MNRLHICFVGLKCYDLIANVPKPRYFGGAERQQVFLARGLARRGHHVSFVTLDFGQEDAVIHDGIQVFKAYSADDGVPGLRFIHPRWTGLAGAMRRAGAQVYYQMGADSETGQVAHWCRRNRRGFVFSVASDSDCDRALPRLVQRRRRMLYRYGLHRASSIVTQTNAQQQMLRSSFDLPSHVIRNCTTDPGYEPERRVTFRSGSSRRQLLWVGRFVTVKRLEVLLDLASTRPEWEFHVVGSGDSSTAYVRDLEQRAIALPNVSLHRGISDAELHERYLRADALVCTSSWEGVPTTFLEAWARGVPVVSTVDPDGVIAAHELGIVSRAEGLAEAAARLLASDLSAWGSRVRNHYLANHTIAASVDAHERTFSGVSDVSS
jgi:glycosyltransferase involved in cell wall biosynthesis